MLVPCSIMKPPVVFAMQGWRRVSAIVIRVFGLNSSIFCSRSMASSGLAEYLRARLVDPIGGMLRSASRIGSDSVTSIISW